VFYVNLLLELKAKITSVEVSIPTSITSASLSLIAQHFGSTLEELTLHSTPLDDATLEEFCARSPSLKVLSLNGSACITDRSVGKISNLSQLEHLDLENCKEISEKKIQEIAKKMAPRLKLLNIVNCKVTEKTLNKMKTAYPHLQLLHTEGDTAISHPIGFTHNIFVD
jgi:hypothetical protein